MSRQKPKPNIKCRPCVSQQDGEMSRFRLVLCTPPVSLQEDRTTKDCVKSEKQRANTPVRCCSLPSVFLPSLGLPLKSTCKFVPMTTWEEHKNCQQAEPGQKSRHTPKKLEHRFSLVFKCSYVAVLLVSGATPRSPPFPSDGTLELPSQHWADSKCDPWIQETHLWWRRPPEPVLSPCLLSPDILKCSWSSRTRCCPEEQRPSSRCSEDAAGPYGAVQNCWACDGKAVLPALFHVFH